MKRPKLIVASESEEINVLIVDRESVLGPLLVNSVQSQFHNAKVIGIGDWKKQPKIPDLLYTHIVLFVNDKEGRGVVSEFLKKAKNDKAKVFFVVKQYSKYAEEFLRSEPHDPDMRILVVGEVFGKKIPFNPQYVIHRLFNAASHSKKLIVRGMGIQKIHPVFVEDVLQGMLQVIFGEADDSLYYLYPQNSPTELSVATTFLKLDPLLTMDFESYEEEKVASYEGVYVIDDSYPLEEKIKQEKGLYGEVSEKYGAIQIQEGSGRKTSKVKILIFIIGFFLLPLIASLFSLFAGMGFAQGALYSLERGDMQSAQNSFKTTRILFSISQNTAGFLQVPLSAIGKGEEFGLLMQDFVFAQDLLSGSEHLLKSVDRLQKVLHGTTVSPQEDFAEGINNAKHAMIIYQKLQGEYALKKEKSLFRHYPRLNNLLEGVHELEFVQNLFQNTADSLPIVFGMEQKKKYLVLFQNNMELRPGGGFIGSYGLLDIDKGKVENFSIHDVYDADGQLKAHIEPPFAIRRHLPSVHWYLRDSNFNVDFSKSASVSAYFLKEETGTMVDGVIGLDTSFIKNILEVTGPVFVSDYNERVSAENFVPLTQKYIQKDFFPGSTQKKDFLRSLFHAISEEVVGKKHISYIKLLGILDKSISEKHALFAFSDNALQNIFTSSNASSALKDTRPEEEQRINDFLGVNEANLGVNKVNYFIKRKISHHVGVSENGLISSQVVLMYKNSSSGESAKQYKAYVQLIVPSGSQITEITVNNIAQVLIPAVTDPRVYEHKSFVKPEGLEVETYEQEGKTIFGFLITVPSSTLQTLVVRYALGKSFPLDAPNSLYSYKHFKQPGTDETILSYSFEHPSLKVVSKPHEIQTSGRMLRFETELKKDILLDFTLRLE